MTETTIICDSCKGARTQFELTRSLKDLASAGIVTGNQTFSARLVRGGKTVTEIDLDKKCFERFQSSGLSRLVKNDQAHT